MRQPEYFKIQQGLVSGSIEGFFCETIVTCEGIQKIDRAEVLSSMTLTSTRENMQNEVGEDVIKITIKPEMPKRKPLHPEVLSRLQAALKVGMRVLGAPRIGGVRIEDPNNVIYFQEVTNSVAQSERLDRYHKAAMAIEGRGVGFAQIYSLAAKLAQRADVRELWYKSLGRTKDVHEENAVKRAVAEWADGDTIAAHIGYGIDFLCTEDNASKSNVNSIFNKENRDWLNEHFSVQIIGLSDLAKMI
ncbi:hypothetical protein [Crenothrix sp.]|uniref:hypothetical protein n=1 Tax=Crenothrix sp. TaxID=3100433 RepID=UPI00374CDC91